MYGELFNLTYVCLADYTLGADNIPYQVEGELARLLRVTIEAARRLERLGYGVAETTSTRTTTSTVIDHSAASSSAASTFGGDMGKL